jgi:hypothetical protein
MTQLRVVALVVAALWLVGCGPRKPPVPPAPPPTKASLTAEGKEKVKRVLGYIEEMEQIRGIAKDEGSPIAVDEPAVEPKGKKGKATKPATPPPPKTVPRPAGMDENAAMELDRLISRAREIKDQIVAMREELGETLETMQDPIEGKNLAKARAVLGRMSEKVGDVRDQRTRALELKPVEKKPEPKPEPKPADTKAPPAKK